MSERDPYILRADGRVHDTDVRFVSTTPDGHFLTGARDNTAQILPIPEDSDAIERGRLYVGHEAFVNVALYHPGLAALDGAPCLVTGSNDHHVALWHVESASVAAVLDGHAQGVCCAAILTNVKPRDAASTTLSWEGDILTGDWGGACLVFDHATGRVKQAYTQHATAIRGVEQLPGTSLVVSGSGDKTAHVWDVCTGITFAVLSGHADVVQCVCAVDAARVATGSNDCSIRVWQVPGGACEVLQGHDSLVYTLAWHEATRELLSASEDRSVKIWAEAQGVGRGGWQLRQSIQHPCVVWSVAPVPHTGDVVSAGSDGALRLWTRDYDQMASADKLELLEAAVAAQRMDLRVAAQSSAAAAGGLDVAAMPRVDEIHTRRGTHAGEKLFARNEAGEVEVYVWGSNRWDKIGVVVSGPGQQAVTGGGASGSSGGAPAAPRERHAHKGRMYDYLFNVEAEGKKLLLPYNAGTSIFEAAQDFINEHRGVVAQDSQEEIQNFLMQNISPEDLARVPGLGGAAAAPRAVPVAASPVAAAADSLQAWAEPLRFTTFNAAGASGKILALTQQPQDGELVQAVDRAAATALVAPEAAAALAERIVQLYGRLPAADRFPAVDLARHLLQQPPAGAVAPVLAAVAPLHDAAVRGTEAVVWMRLAANTLAALAPDTVLTPQAAALLEWAVGAGAVEARAAAAAAAKGAALAAVRNAAVAVARGRCPAAHAGALAATAVRTVGKYLLLEPNGSPAVADLVASLLALYESGAPAPAALVELGRAVLLHSLRAVEGGSTGALRKGAAALLAILTAGMPEEGGA